MLSVSYPENDIGWKKTAYRLSPFYRWIIRLLNWIERVNALNFSLANKCIVSYQIRSCYDFNSCSPTQFTHLNLTHCKIKRLRFREEMRLGKVRLYDWGYCLVKDAMGARMYFSTWGPIEGQLETTCENFYHVLLSLWNWMITFYCLWIIQSKELYYSNLKRL